MSIDIVDIPKSTCYTDYTYGVTTFRRINVHRQADTSIITVKGQIVIPSKMRRKLGLKKGTKVSLVDRGDEIIVRALTKDYFERMAGVLKTGGRLTRRLLEERAKDRDLEASK